ncbi:hypothetical protein ACIOUE_30065 [Streptomyces xanthochromogenes]|uniref:hypothetical protein n=1 Tax=Streptomyces xanthochromogenes TaxID=67384 RepID=UPI003829CABB
MPASNAALTVWQDVTPRPRAERRGAQAVANVRRAAHIHAFGVDGTDWALMARVYQRAVGAAGWWRLGAACAVLPVGLAAQLAALHVLARYGQDVPLAALPFASGPLGVVEGLLFALLVAVVWCAVMFGPAFLICQVVKRVARKPPAWTERPVPPALAVAETEGTGFVAALLGPAIPDMAWSKRSSGRRREPPSRRGRCDNSYRSDAGGHR